jgi:two-component sensor histidine kinase
LVEQVVESTLVTVRPDKQVSVDVSPSPVRVNPKEANNLALVISELTTNSIKHAWANRQEGRISVHICCIGTPGQGDTIVLEYRDDGVGYPENVLRLKRYGTGYELIQSIIGHGGLGRISLRNDGGAVTIIRFKDLDTPGVQLFEKRPP